MQMTSLKENKRSEICKNLTFKIQKSDQKYGIISQQSLKNLAKLKNTHQNTAE